MTESDISTSDESVPDQSEQLDLQPEEMLLETGRDDMLDGGYEVPDHWSAGQGFGNTPEEQAEGETLDQRLRQEEPDVGAGAGAGAGSGPVLDPDAPADPLDPDLTRVDLVGEEDLDNTTDDMHAGVAGGALRGATAGDLDDEDFAGDPDDELVAGTEVVDDGEVGDEQVVRLVDPNEGIGEDVDSDLIGSDAGGSSEQTAEEAAVHVVPES